jgi:hypothetical protein
VNHKGCKYKEKTGCFGRFSLSYVLILLSLWLVLKKNLLLRCLGYFRHPRYLLKVCFAPFFAVEVVVAVSAVEPVEQVFPGVEAAAEQAEVVAALVALVSPEVVIPLSLTVVFADAQFFGKAGYLNRGLHAVLVAFGAFVVAFLHGFLFLMVFHHYLFYPV